MAVREGVQKYVIDAVTRIRSGLMLSAALSSLICLFSCQESNMKTSAHPLPPDAPRTTNVRPQQQRSQPPFMVETESGAPEIRVAILKDTRTLKIATGGADAVVFNSAGQEVSRVPANTEVQFDPSPTVASILMTSSGPVNVSDAAPASNDGTLRIEMAHGSGSVLKINGQDVASRVTLYRAGPQRGITAVARLDLEEYLFGVLGGEVPFERWHPEALKAQAIASRSYAYYQIKSNANQPYDVESTVMSQVFKPGFRSNPILSQAVNSTHGLIMTYNGAPFSAYFHSTCGGHTDNGAAVFPDQAQAKALHGVNCPYCGQSPSYRWRWTIGKDALTEKLRPVATGGQLGQVRGVEFLDVSGMPIGSQIGSFRRVTTVRIRHAYGTFELTGNAFRLAVGARDLKSLLLCQVIDRPDFLDVSGGGYGHGVGMCQYGSQGMALAGQQYQTILGMYYPGAALTRMY
jgi:stage II sporulation protein D